MRNIICILTLLLGVIGQARAGVITFTSATPDPNPTSIANTGAYGSSANVSVGYSADTYNYWPGGYGGLDGGTGVGIFSFNDTNTLTMTFTAAPGYTVTLNSFDLAQFRNSQQAVTITITGGSPFSSLTDTPLGSGTSPFLSTYTPNVTGTSLTLTITDLYDVGLNNLSFSETQVSAPVPEPATLAVFGGLALAGALGYRRRMRAAAGA